MGQDPLWTVRVNIKNNGPGVAENVSATMHEDIPWLDDSGSDMYLRKLSPSGSSPRVCPDRYTYDLTTTPGGSFNAWFDVSY